MANADKSDPLRKRNPLEFIISFAERYFSNIRLWRKTVRMQDKDLALDGDFLRTILSYDPEQDSNTAWRIFQLSRVRHHHRSSWTLLPIWLLPHRHHGSPQGDRSILGTYASLAVLFLGIAGFVLVELLMAPRRYSSLPTDEARVTWVKRMFICEMLAVSLLYAVTNNAYSDVAYLYIVPLTYVAEFLPFRSAVRRLRLLPLCLLLSAYAANKFAAERTLQLHILLVNVVLTRTILIGGLILIFLYIRRVTAARRAVLRALLEAIPEGLALVSKPDYRIRWANGVILDTFFSGRPLLGEVCYHAYKCADKKCDPCPTERAFGGELSEQITRSPEFIIQSKQGPAVPPPDEWRHFDTFCAPVKIEGEIVAALELVRDVTCREVIGDATKALQAATTQEAVLGRVARAIRNLGYRRCRVYLLSQDGCWLVMQYLFGMEDVLIPNFKLPLLGEPYSAETLNSDFPRVCPATLDDLYRDALKKDPALPWLELPLKLNGEFFGKISIDNKGHPDPSRRILHAEAIAESKSPPPRTSGVLPGPRITGLENLIALHNLGVQATLALQRIRSRAERADLMSAYVHFSVGLLNVLPTSAAQLLNDSSTAGERSDRRAAYEHICGAATVISEYGKALQNWADLHRGTDIRISVQPTNTDVTDLLREVRSWFLFDIDAYKCSVDTAPTVPLFAVVDAEIVKQNVFILLKNALDSIKESDRPHSEGRISIRAALLKDDPGLLEISVADNGHGLPEPVSPTLFERGSIKRYGNHLGIGLWLARQFTSAHGGIINFRNNRPGNGVEFYLVLPVGCQ